MGSDDKTPEGEFLADDAVEVFDVSALIEAHEPGNDFEADIPTVVDDAVAGILRNLCPLCGDDAMHLDDSVQPPSNHGEAWKRGFCYGNSRFKWCKGPFERKGEGRLVLVGTMEVFFFRDRRLVERPVETERRGLPKGKP